MNTTEYYTPTRVVLGPDSEMQAGKLVKDFGGTKVLLHYGSNSAIASGLLGRVQDALAKENIAYVTLGGVVPNPRLSKVREGIALCKEEGVDFILAVGGGSVIDSAKAIGYGVLDDGDVWDFYLKTRVPAACLPVGCVLTIAAAGSEMSNSSVITNDETWLKRGTNSDLCRCRFCIMNPTLTTTLPAYQTACGCVDILMHTMERYFRTDASMEISDSIAEALMRTVITNARILLTDPNNYDARAEILWASSLSHNGLTGVGAIAGDWASHMMEHEVGGMFDVAHGAGLAALWGTWARYVYDAAPARFARFATTVLGIAPLDSDEATALAGIEAMEAFYRELDMPTNLTELGLTVTDEQIDEMADKGSHGKTGTLGIVKKLAYEDIKQILTNAR